jgi:hypothetical protein
MCSNADQSDDTHPTVSAEFQGQVLDFLLQLLDDDAVGRKKQSEALATLSNFVVEEGVADQVAVYDELMTAVIERSLMTTGSVRANAVWVLANLISHVKGVVAIEAVRTNCGVWTALQEAAADGHDIGRWRADVVAAEGLARMAAWDAADEATDEDEAEDMEVDEESVESDDSDDSDYVPEEEETDTDDDDDDSATVEEEQDETPVVQMTRRIPNALDLMMGARVPSETVARLANMARVGEWIEVPAELMLTVDDLTSLQLMGYMIYRGYIGINPMLSI